MHLQQHTEASQAEERVLEPGSCRCGVFILQAAILEWTRRDSNS